MSRRSVAAVLLVAALGAAVTVAAVARPGKRATPSPRGERLLGPTPAAQTVAFTLVLRLPGKERLARFLREVNDPASPRYRHYIDAKQFGTRFGLDGAVLRKVTRRLERQGLAVTASYPQRTTLEVRGPASALRRVFAVRLNEYRDAKGRKFHSPASKPRVPRALAAAVTGVAGLNTRPFDSRLAEPTQIGFKPADFARAYGIDQLWERGIRGQGQTVAVWSETTFNDSDVRRFDRAVGISSPGVCTATVKAGCIERVPVNGGTTDTHAEDALDVETIHGLAPGATVLNYESPTDTSKVETYNDWGRAFVAAMVAGVNKIVSDGRATIISISYGAPDAAALGPKQLFSDADMEASENAFAAALAKGINTFVATGDQGAFQCQQIDITVHEPCVAWPAQSPSVIAVGGTLLDIDKQGNYLEETGWQDTLSAWGGGGGVSERFARPSWQTKSVPGVDNRYSTGKRQIPDVASAASQGSGTYVVFEGQAQPVGGTSASAPFWAAYTALVAQNAQQRGAGKLPFLNPVLYRLAASPQVQLFHDVIRGGNRYHPATAGWDYASGLGSPNGLELAQAIAAAVKR
ncbi:MAG: S53 family peptidase [Actinomycetota bacterium]|nr:S53 family peptidase [Actinomycetota bacterium]